MSERTKASTAGGGADRLSALPDDILQHVLSFLQAQEAVRSCVLAWRWRFLWKSMPVFRLTGCRPVQESHEFMDHLLILRDRSPLDACLLDVDADSDSDARYVNLWLRYAVLYNVLVLSFSSRNLLGLHAVSNLTQVELSYTTLHDTLLDFLGSPSLEEL